MRKVMIGTPCYTGNVHCRYTNAMAATIKLGLRLGIDVYPLFIPGQAMIHTARNDVVRHFLATDCTDLVFIDSDIGWEAEDFFRLINADVAAIGATYRYKSPDVRFVMKTEGGEVPDLTINPTKVIGLGMGFFRLSRATVEDLWQRSDEYMASDGVSYRAVFEFKIIDGKEVGEDIAMCMKLPEVYLDPTIILQHCGDTVYTGDPIDWLISVRDQADISR